MTKKNDATRIKWIKLYKKVCNTFFSSTIQNESDKINLLLYFLRKELTFAGTL